MPVRTYQDIFKDYGAYVEAQKGRWASHEANVPKWEEGQQRYVEAVFSTMNRDFRILDIACGDGVGLRQFQRLGFMNVVGVEFNEAKLAKAKECGYPVLPADMHDLSGFPDQSFHVVYSSHTLEHAYRPSQVLSEFHRILIPGGMLLVVLPYPDSGTFNDEAHGAKYELGTNIDDGGKTVVEYFAARGFTPMPPVFDSFREPEIWMFFTRAEASA